MITFKQYITELFDKPIKGANKTYGIKKIRQTASDSENRLHKYKFRVPGDTDDSLVHIKHSQNGKFAEVIFKTPDIEGGHTTSQTGDYGSSSVRVFSPVSHIMRVHAKKHPELKHFVIGAKGTEPSRVRLYDTISRRMGGTYQSEKNGVHYFNLPTNQR
jgi:hypothetical protein